MSVPIQKKISQLSKADQKKVQERADTLIASQMSLQALRKTLNVTQAVMAQSLEIRQEGVSRLEKRQDLRISTLQNYVEALGGHLKLIVEFPDQPPVELTGFGEGE